MLPAAYQVPAAAVLIAGGFLACFFGYRLFKAVLAVFGFIIGALAASSVFGATDTAPMVIAALVGGIAGAALLLAAYFVGVALIGAGIGALLVNLIWTQVEGEATAIYLARLLKPMGIRVTRIAMGIPVGSDLDYADDLTMGKSMEGRREV